MVSSLKCSGSPGGCQALFPAVNVVAALVVARLYLYTRRPHILCNLCYRSRDQQDEGSNEQRKIGKACDGRELEGSKQDKKVEALCQTGILTPDR